MILLNPNVETFGMNQDRLSQVDLGVFHSERPVIIFTADETRNCLNEEIKMATVYNIDAPVIVPAFGDNYHLFADCRGIAQGWANSEKFGRTTFETETMTLGDAIVAHKFGCIICHNKANVEIPINADRKAFRRANAQKRAARKAEREAAAAMKLALELVAEAERLTAMAAESATLVA
jgi:hypothetical protein